jgi:hypothetical protein
VSGAPQLVCRSNPSISAEQARDARARAWAYIFQCWQEKQKPAEPTPEPNERNDGALVRDTEGVSCVEHQPDRPSEVTKPAAL